MKDGLERIREIAGEGNWSEDPLDLLCYSRDLAPVPDDLLASYGMIPPALVVRPRNAEKLSGVLKEANSREIPVTLRGGGSSALGGVLPMEGGVVLDLCGMSRILEINEADEYVRVECGIEWKRLIDRLDKLGFRVGANASSGVSATVGGYIGTGGGAGIGVPRRGVLGDQILGLRVALADGQLLETGPWDSWLFVGSEGTLGAVCEATLRIFPKVEERCCMLAFDSLGDGIEAYRRIERLHPYYLHFLDRGAVGFLRRTDSGLRDAAATIVTLIEGSREGLAAAEREIEEISARPGVHRYGEEAARAEWNDRYKIELSFKKLGPTLMLQELRLPRQEFEGVMADLARELAGEQWGVQTLSSERGSICLLIYILTDERDRKKFIRALSYAGTIPKIGYRHGGTVYGIALHNSVHLRRTHGAGAVRMMREIKRELDPKNVLNPSKTTEVRVPGFLVDISMFMMRHFPRLVGLGLAITGKMPRSLVRAGLRVVGGRLR